MCGTFVIGKAPTPKWMLSRKGLNVLTNTAYPVCRRGRHFYFRLFLLSRKVSNAMMKPPKEISKAKIPRKTIIISYAVIYATSLPMYSLAREATTLSWVLSLDSILTYISFSLQEQLQYKSYFIVSFPILSNSILLPLQYTFLFHLEIHPQNLLPYSNNKLIHYSQKHLMKLY